MTTSGYTDKIRAVIYPNQRSWSTTHDGNTAGEGQFNTVREQKEQRPVRSAQETSWSARSPQNASAASPPYPPANSTLPTGTFVNGHGQGRQWLSKTRL